MKIFLIIILSVVFIILFSVLIKQIKKHQDKYAIKIFNKTIGGRKAALVRKIITKRNRTECEKLPSSGYSNFILCDPDTPPHKYTYYSVVTSKGEIYEVINFIPKPNVSNYIKFEMKKSEKRKIKRIFRFY